MTGILEPWSDRKKETVNPRNWKASSHGVVGASSFNTNEVCTYHPSLPLPSKFTFWKIHIPTNRAPTLSPILPYLWAAIPIPVNSVHSFNYHQLRPSTFSTLSIPLILLWLLRSIHFCFLRTLKRWEERLAASTVTERKELGPMKRMPGLSNIFRLMERVAGAFSPRPQVWHVHIIYIYIQLLFLFCSATLYPKFPSISILILTMFLALRKLVSCYKL